MIRFVVAAALIVAAALPAHAQEAEAPAAPQTVPETIPEAAPQAAPQAADDDPNEVIVVVGQRPEGLSLREYVHDFVIELTDPPSGDHGYALWDDDICVGVENLEADSAQYIADRVSDVARQVGLRPEGPGCRPNIAIVFAADGQTLASRLVEDQPGLFRPYGGVSGTTQGLAALNRFATSDAAVRWWQITMVVDDMGRVATVLPTSLSGPPTVRGANSLITNSVHDEMWASYIIVDASKLEGVTWRQIADYLAMVALAQINPEARPGGYDTILNLFSSSRPAPGMTEWDEIYLQSLYELDTRRMPRMQPGSLTSVIARNHRSDPDED